MPRIVPIFGSVKAHKYMIDAHAESAEGPMEESDCNNEFLSLGVLGIDNQHSVLRVGLVERFL